MQDEIAPPAPLSRRTDLLVLAIIVLGCALRLAWALHGHLTPSGGEADSIARALAEGRGYADAFGRGSGPTAHLMPLTPLPTALAYALLGEGTRAAELALTLWALLTVGVSLFLAERVTAELGVPRWGRLAALACAAVLPIQFALEVTQFREWEAGLATVGLLGLLLAVLRLHRSPAISARALVGLGIANGALFVLSPPTALATSGAIGLFLLRKVSWRRWWLPIAPAAVIVVAVLIPWGLRNEHVLGRFTPLRTGEGISLALSYYDGKAGDSGPTLQALDLKRIQQVSPQRGGAPLQRYHQIGEVAYNHELVEQTKVWMKAHPADVAKIRIRNVIEFFAPPSWLWTRFTTGDGSFIALRRGFVALSAVLGLITIGAGLARRRFDWLYVAAAVLLPAVPYIATYPLLRYRYVVSTLLIMLGVGGCWMLAQFCVARLSGRPAGPPPAQVDPRSA